VNAILELGALADEHHPCPRQVALVAQLARRDPDRWECAGALELIEPSDVELIRLVDLAHHEFGLAGVHEPGDATGGGLDLVDDPIPIANGLDRHRGAGLTSLKDVVTNSALVFPVRRLAADGFQAWAQVLGHDYEGMVAKDETSAYEGGATRRWLKVKQNGWTIGDERWTRRISVNPNRPAVAVEGDGGQWRGR
jgi:hypothetical protein